MFGSREAYGVDFTWEGHLTIQHRTTKLKNRAHILPRPCVNQMARLLIELLRVENNTNIAQNVKRYEALLWAIALSIADDIMDGLTPAGVGCVDGYVCQAHAEAVYDHFMIAYLLRFSFFCWAHELEDFIPELYDMRVFKGEISEVFFELLKQNLGTDVMLLIALTRCSLNRRYVIQQLK